MKLRNSTRMAGARTAVAAVFTLAALAGCAMPPPADDKEAVAAFNEANDPFEPLNRYFFEVNRAVDQMLLRPVAEIYRGTLPEGIRTSVRGVINNLETPGIFVHDVLQGEMERAGDSFGRFTANSIMGAGGIGDVAASDNPKNPDAGIPFHNEDLGQTLAVWGAGPGPYLMLPLLGPSNVRDGLGQALNFYINPINYVVPNEHRTGFSLARTVVRGIDTRSRNIETFDEIERGSIDFYATVRSLYRQYRAAEIANGRGPENPLPEMSDRLEEDNEAERVSSVNK
ncbi:MAG: VacJ family lipoprotein [Rhodospirillaceae bacterium]|jgi:phospholipid-binding lipoprotein MlaA|nr:VacJ family lipoprotein [Rhodospirillaceae bacterium]